MARLGVGINESWHIMALNGTLCHIVLIAKSDIIIIGKKP